MLQKQDSVSDWWLKTKLRLWCYTVLNKHTRSIATWRVYVLLTHCLFFTVAFSVNFSFSTGANGSCSEEKRVFSNWSDRGRLALLGEYTCQNKIAFSSFRLFLVLNAFHNDRGGMKKKSLSSGGKRNSWPEMTLLAGDFSFHRLVVLCLRKLHLCSLVMFLPGFTVGAARTA